MSREQRHGSCICSQFVYNPYDTKPWGCCQVLFGKLNNFREILAAGGIARRKSGCGGAGQQHLLFLDNHYCRCPLRRLRAAPLPEGEVRKTRFSVQNPLALPSGELAPQSLRGQKVNIVTLRDCTARLTFLTMMLHCTYK